MTSALKCAAIGGVGAGLVTLSKKFLGSGLIGGIGGIAIAGSVLKGSSGEMISTILGYQLVKDLFDGTLSTSTSTSTSTSSEEVI